MNKMEKAVDTAKQKRKALNQAREQTKDTPLTTHDDMLCQANSIILLNNLLTALKNGLNGVKDAFVQAKELKVEHILKELEKNQKLTKDFLANEIYNQLKNNIELAENFKDRINNKDDILKNFSKKYADINTELWNAKITEQKQNPSKNIILNINDHPTQADILNQKVQEKDAIKIQKERQK